LQKTAREKLPLYSKKTNPFKFNPDTPITAQNHVAHEHQAPGRKEYYSKADCELCCDIDPDIIDTIFYLQQFFSNSRVRRMPLRSQTRE
jgi:hypothetical protein